MTFNPISSYYFNRGAVSSLHMSSLIISWFFFLPVASPYSLICFVIPWFAFFMVYTVNQHLLIRQILEVILNFSFWYYHYIQCAVIVTVVVNWITVFPSLYHLPLLQPNTCIGYNLIMVEEEFFIILNWRLANWRRSGIFIVNFEHVSHLVLVFLLLTLNM